MRGGAGRRKRSEGLRGAAITLLRVSDPIPRAPVQHSLVRLACPRFSVVSSPAAVTSSSGTGCGRISFRIELAMAFTLSCQSSARPGADRDTKSARNSWRGPRNCLIPVTKLSARSSVEREEGGRQPELPAEERVLRRIGQAHSTREAEALQAAGRYGAGD